MNRTVFDPKRSVKAPTRSSQIVILGCRPFQSIWAAKLPAASVTVVRRYSTLGSSCSTGDECFTKAGEEDVTVGDGDLEEDGRADEIDEETK